MFPIRDYCPEAETSLPRPPSLPGFKPPALKSARVLIVEDHLMVAELYAELLRGLPEVGRTEVVGTVEAAIKRAGEERPDLVVLDWMLPDGRGFHVHDVCRDQLRQVRWALVTSHGNRHVVREAHHRGFHGCVQKQEAKSTLQMMVSQVLKGGMYYCPLTVKIMHEVDPPELQLLSEQERKILRFFSLGYNNKEIAGLMGCAVKNVQNHFGRAKGKLGYAEPAELVAFALRVELVSLVEIGRRGAM